MHNKQTIQTKYNHNNTIIANNIETIAPLNNTASLSSLHNKVSIGVLFITSYPPRECGIATYSQDLILALQKQLQQSFSITICALESNDEQHQYQSDVEYRLNTDNKSEYTKLAIEINQNQNIQIVLVQHEFGFFNASKGNDFLLFITQLAKPVILAFHTVLPQPNEALLAMVQCLAASSTSTIVMTNASKHILMHDYQLDEAAIDVIAHGTHLVSNNNKKLLKNKYKLTQYKILTTFGLINSGKCIETTLHALPAIIEKHPDVLFLAIGKTHPVVVKHDGEVYRQSLEAMVDQLGLKNHVRFINQYLSLPVLLEYLRLTDIYLFTSKDPNQAVSGTFSYAMSCGCPIIATPIPQAREMLDQHTGIIVDFQNPQQLSTAVVALLNDEPLRKNISINTLHKIATSAWENSAIAHGLLFEKTISSNHPLQYTAPAINLTHLKQLSTEFGIIQFSRINQPDHSSGYTLDDNARALIALCMHYENTTDDDDIPIMFTYLRFIMHCLQPNNSFFNYVDKQKSFTNQNSQTNLDDANGRALWALGFIISKKDILPKEMIQFAESIITRIVKYIGRIHSSRAMAFSIKGLYYYNSAYESAATQKHIETFANRLLEMYKHESSPQWQWFESYLTYANSVLPEAMLFAAKSLGKTEYSDIALQSFHFLLSQTFNDTSINLISNKDWHQRGQQNRGRYGEQPIDVAYTILALQSFNNFYPNADYLHKQQIAFSWFLGNNHLHQIIYNPCTGGCYDGLEQHQVNLNQGAESTISYLMARISMIQ